MKIYIAGPMTGHPEWNFPAFTRAAHTLRALGYEVASPHELFTHTDRPWAFYMKAALITMLTCDAIFMLDGWENSRGASIEQQLASELDYHTLFENEGYPIHKEFNPLCQAPCNPRTPT
jgi:Domain of unknown function (DUF4406)